MTDLGTLTHQLLTNDYILVQKVISQTGKVEEPYLYRVQNTIYDPLPEINAFQIENGEEVANEILSGYYGEYIAMVLGHWKHSPSYIEMQEAMKKGMTQKMLNNREIEELKEELHIAER